MRRVLSILLYVVAGLFLTSWSVIAFVDFTPEASKAEMFGVMAPFALVPLALGAWASPGARLREVGIVLLAAMGWSAFTVGSLAYMLLMPDTRKTLPPETLKGLEMFNDYLTGGAFILLTAAAGIALLVYGGRRPALPDREGR